MAILRVRQIPDPVLYKISNPIAGITEELRFFSQDLLLTMQHYPSCVGLAAPQVGKLVRMIAIDVSRYPKKHPNHGELILINPSIITLNNKQIGREGCLSVPEFTANVARFQEIRVGALNLDGKHVTIDAVGFEAVVLQHEIDHLDGMVFLDRVSSLKTDVFRRKTR
jgi:peptide deformylase